MKLRASVINGIASALCVVASALCGDLHLINLQGALMLIAIGCGIAAIIRLFQETSE